MRRALIVLTVLVLIAAGAVYGLFSRDAVRRALEAQASARLGQPVRIGSASGRIFPRAAIHLGDVRVGDPVRLTLADVEVSTGLRALLSRRVEDAEIVIANSRIDLPLPFSLPASSSEAAATQQSDAGITIASIRAIRLRDIRLASRGREVVVSADSALTGSRLDVSRFSARAGKTSLEASGIVQLEPRLDARIQASANELDLDDLLALADAFAPAPQPQKTRRTGSLVTGRITAKLKATRGHAAGVEMRDLAGDLVVQGNHVMLSPVSFELFGGRYDGALQANVGNDLALSLTSRITGLDVARLAAFGGVPDTITGRLSGSGRFTGTGRDMAAALASAAGNADAEIADGTLKRLNLVRTVVLFFGRPAADDPGGAGERFNRIATSFTLRRQVVHTDSLSMQSPDVDLVASGTLTIPTKALDGTANIILSEALSSQAGTDLVRYTRQGDRVVLPATIGGSLAQPSVMIDAAAAVQRGLRNEVERRLKGFLDRFKPPSQP